MYKHFDFRCLKCGMVFERMIRNTEETQFCPCPDKAECKRLPAASRANAAFASRIILPRSTHGADKAGKRDRDDL